jgi:hypothetical protein
VKTRRVMPYLIALSAILLGALGRAQTFKVRVLDALNGKPYDNMPVNYFCFREGERAHTSYKTTVTDSNGFAEILYECKKGETISLLTGALDGKSKWTGNVEECGYLGPQSIEQIMQVGLISKPTAAGGIWCPAKVSEKLKPIPGQVIIFAKKPTWWQKHVAP